MRRTFMAIGTGFLCVFLCVFTSLSGYSFTDPNCNSLVPASATMCLKTGDYKVCGDFPHNLVDCNGKQATYDIQKLSPKCDSGTSVQYCSTKNLVCASEYYCKLAADPQNPGTYICSQGDPVLDPNSMPVKVLANRAYTVTCVKGG